MTDTIKNNNKLDEYGQLTEPFESTIKYDCKKITEYCRANNKALSELSQEELDQFIIE